MRQSRRSRGVEGLPSDWPANHKLTDGLLKLSFVELTDDPNDKNKLLEITGQTIYDRQSASKGIQVTRARK